MASAFGGQRSIQLSYGCVGADLACELLAASRVKEAGERLLKLSSRRADDHPDMSGRDLRSLPFAAVRPA